MATSTTSTSTSGTLKVLVRVDHPPSTPPVVMNVDGSKTWAALTTSAATALKLPAENVIRYSAKGLLLGRDVVELNDTDSASIPLTALGVESGWTILLGAPAELKPSVRRRKKVEEKDEKVDADVKFAGLTTSNIFTKLKTSQGKARKTQFEFIDKRFREIAKERKRDLMALPAPIWVEILKSDKLNAKESDLFTLVMAWGKEEVKRKGGKEGDVEALKTAIGPVIQHVRLPLFSATDMALLVSPSRILAPDQELAIYSYIAGAAERKSKGKSSSSSSSSFFGGKKETKSEAPAKVAGFSTAPRKTLVNFTFDPEKKGSAIFLSEGNLVMTGGPSHKAGLVLATEGFSEGVHYWEVKVDKGRSSGHHYLGLALPGTTLENDLSRPTCFGWWYDGGAGISGPLCTNQRGSFTFSVGQTVGLLLDFDRKLLQMYVNKLWTGEVTITTPNTYYPVFGCYGSADQFTLLQDVELPENIQ